ncbi:DNA repair protein XRCC4, putative isoform 1 [Capsicum annuum]|nr:DNA repair protein XRCC4, putative isoform 1 [Capsicum annuum]
MEVGWSVLTTSGQPFVIDPDCNGLHRYQMVFLMYISADGGETGIVQLAEQLISTKDSHNVSFSDADKSAGYANAKGDLSEFFLKKGTYSAFVKLHIEQGLILEKGISIGVVTAIAAPASIKVTFEGNGGHAGAALMPKRYYYYHFSCLAS